MKSTVANKVTVISNKFTAFRIGTWSGGGGWGSSHISKEIETAIIDVSRPCVIRNLHKKKGRILCSQKFWFVSEFP